MDQPTRQRDYIKSTTQQEDSDLSLKLCPLSNRTHHPADPKGAGRGRKGMTGVQRKKP